MGRFSHSPRHKRAPTSARALTSVLLALVATSLPEAGAAQPPSPAPNPLPTAIPGPSNDELLREIRALRKEVAETRVLKDQVGQLRKELSTLRPVSARTPALPATQPDGPPGTSARELNRTRSGATEGNADFGSMVGGGTASGEASGELVRSQPSPTTSNEPGPTEDAFPLHGSYKYNNGTGALGGGGYFHIADPDEEFVMNVTNQITIDGTFFDRQNMPTIEQGFNVPFARTFLYGNITKNWLYQIGTQGFLGEFNLLDMWMAYRFSDKLTVRFGKGLTPPLYE
jgi:phosphate-selective porin OprO/OprP